MVNFEEPISRSFKSCSGYKIFINISAYEDFVFSGKETSELQEQINTT